MTRESDLPSDERAAFDDGRLYLIIDSISSRDLGSVDLVHVMSRPACGEIRGYWSPKDSGEPWRIRLPNYTGDWAALDTEVTRITGRAVAAMLASEVAR